MGLDITSAFRASGINLNTPLSGRPQVQFHGNLTEDRFESTSANRFTNETVLNKLIAQNPKIQKILKEVDAPVKLNMKELDTLLKTHCSDVQNIARGITENLPFSLKNNVDSKALDDACFLHDIGKVLIPAEVLNKKGKLNKTETEIMHKHSELGYELLKNTNLDKKTLDLIRNHHQDQKRSGYPFVSNDFKADLNLQILTMSDRYSALTEKRVYKEPMSPKEALTVIYADVKAGKLHPFVFKALVNFVNTTESKVTA